MQEVRLTFSKAVSARGPVEELSKRYAFAHRSWFQAPKMDILVADDDRSGRFLLNFTLIELGHRVTEFGNGCDAWEAWKCAHHQLIISDWMMPGIDGWGSAEEFAPTK